MTAKPGQRDALQAILLGNDGEMPGLTTPVGGIGLGARSGTAPG